jgi:hypothetical protein
MVAARAGAECASMSVNRNWMSAIRQQRCTLLVGPQHPIDEAGRTAWSFLRDVTDPRPFARRDTAVVGMQFARDKPQKRRFARTVTADEPDFVTRRNAGSRGIEYPLALDVKRQVVNVQHGAIA